jgi:hypothetical protein
MRGYFYFGKTQNPMKNPVIPRLWSKQIAAERAMGDGSRNTISAYKRRKKAVLKSFIQSNPELFTK